MKIRISVTVDVDPETWANTYGTSTDRNEVRDDVKSYFNSQVRDLPITGEAGAIITAVK